MEEPANGCFKFRISRSYDAIKPTIDSFFKECSHLALYQHDADEEVARTHVHGVCMGFDAKQVKTFRSRVQKAFDLEPADYACGDIGPKPFQYCSKGRYDPLEFRGWTREYIDERKSEGFDKKKDRVSCKDGKLVIERDVKKEVKIKNDMEMIQEVAKRCDMNNITENEDIANEILKAWNKNNKRGHMRLMIEWLDAVKYSMNEKVKTQWIKDAVWMYEKRMRG